MDGYLSDPDTVESYPQFIPYRPRTRESEGKAEVELLRAELTIANKTISEHTKQIENLWKRMEEMEASSKIQDEKLRKLGKEKQTENSVKMEEFKEYLPRDKPVASETPFWKISLHEIPPPPEGLDNGNGDVMNIQFQKKANDLPLTTSILESLIKIVEKTPAPPKPSKRSSLGRSNASRTKTLHAATPEGKKFPCKLCGASFSLGWQLASHVRTNHPGPVSQGTEWQAPSAHRQRSAAPFAKKSLGARFLEVKSAHASLLAERKFACPNCDERFPTVTKLREHLWNTHEINDDIFGCSACGQVFSDRKQHFIHRKFCRRPNRRVTPSKAPPTLLTWSGKSSSSQQMDHRITTQFGPGFFCSCGASFRSWVHLTKHVNLEPYRARSKQTLLKLTKAKTGRSSTPSARGSKNRVLITKHSLVAPDGKNGRFVCSCGKELITRAAFTNHIQSHQVSFKCNKCQETFPVYDQLRDHFKKAHHGKL